MRDVHRYEQTENWCHVVIILTVSFMMSAMIALTAFLQAEAAWWKGPLASLALVVAGVLLVLAIPNQNSRSPTILEVTPLSVLMFCAALVFVGTVLGLVLRPFMSSGQIAKFVFMFGFAIIFSFLFIGALS